MGNKMRAIHPGEILQEEMDALGYSANRFSAKLHVPPNRVTAILKGKRAITANTALRLARFFDTSPDFWLNLQTTYDLKIAEQSDGKQIKQEVKRGDVA